MQEQHQLQYVWWWMSKVPAACSSPAPKLQGHRDLALVSAARSRHSALLLAALDGKHPLFLNVFIAHRLTVRYFSTFNYDPASDTSDVSPLIILQISRDLVLQPIRAK